MRSKNSLDQMRKTGREAIARHKEIKALREALLSR